MYSSQEKNNLVNVLKLFLNYAYFTGASPFRLVRLGNNTCEAVTWKPQKVSSLTFETSPQSCKLLIKICKSLYRLFAQF